MYTKFELRLALRYTLGHHRSRLGNFLTLMSVLGLIMGVAMLIAVFSVMNGFDREMRDKILALVPHVQLIHTRLGGVVDWQSQIDMIAEHSEVVAVSPYTELDALFRFRNRVEPGLLYAIDAGLELSRAESGWEAAPDQAHGTLAAVLGQDILIDLAQPGVLVLGSGLAARLGVEPGDRVLAMVYGHEHRLRATSFEIVRSLRSGTELDQRLVLIDFRGLARIPGQSSVPQGFRVQVKSVFSARETGRQLHSALPPGYHLSTWEETHGNLYEAIQMSRFLVTLIVLLVLAIAAFNLVATLMIASADKQSEIAILKAMGSTPARLGRAFALQGLIIGLIGSLVGAALGVALASNVTVMSELIESWLGMQLLNSQVYPIDYLPSHLHWGQVLFVVTTALLLSLLAALYPAARVARTQASQVLRYE